MRTKWKTTSIYINGEYGFKKYIRVSKILTLHIGFERARTRFEIQYFLGWFGKFKVQFRGVVWIKVWDEVRGSEFLGSFQAYLVTYIYKYMVDLPNLRIHPHSILAPTTTTGPPKAFWHSSEIRGLHSTKCFSKTLQNLLYFMYKKTHVVFFVFHFVQLNIFTLWMPWSMST